MFLSEELNKNIKDELKFSFSNLEFEIKKFVFNFFSKKQNLFYQQFEF